MNRILIAFVVYLLLRGRFETYSKLATVAQSATGSNVANKGDLGKTAQETLVDLLPQIPGIFTVETTKDVQQKALK